VKATINDINGVDPILGEINGVSSTITIRIYNCSQEDIELIKNNFDVKNIRKIS
jgi:hypothetical protein